MSIPTRLITEAAGNRYIGRQDQIGSRFYKLHKTCTLITYLIEIFCDGFIKLVNII